MAGSVRRVAFYVRVSTDEQRERQTILNQIESLKRQLEATPEADLADTYADDGVSGTIPLADRSGGRRLMKDIDLGRIDEVWVIRADRLGRDASDALSLWEIFKKAGVKLVGVEESIGDYVMFAIRSVLAHDERDKILSRFADGTENAARQGRYTGGIIPLGYTVRGISPEARIVPSDTRIWSDWTEADLVRRIYEWLAIDGRSCRWIASELNRLGVPTAYQKDHRLVSKPRGTRKRNTQGKWRAGRIRNLVVNSVYMGQLRYGRRSKRQREIIAADCEAIVSPELWNAAQQTLAKNRIMAKNTNRIYMLRSKIICSECGLKFCGSWNSRTVWYRCNGRLTDRGPIEGRCPSKMVKGEFLEPIVWTDIERFLREPGDLLEELCDEISADPPAAVAEAERLTLQTALDSLLSERELTCDLYTTKHITAEELDERMDHLTLERAELERRLAALDPTPAVNDDNLLPADLLDLVRAKLRDGLDDAARQEIVSLLVRQITVHPPRDEANMRIVIEYNFVVSTSTDTGSSPPGA